MKIQEQKSHIQQSPSTQLASRINTTPLRFDLRGFAARLCCRLERSGIKFGNDGFPIIPQISFASSIPPDALMYPCSKVSQTPDLSRTILCCFENDRVLIGHLKRLDERIKKWRGCLAFAGFDLSPCMNRPLIEQQQNMWINALVTAYVAASGIPVIANLRSGVNSTLEFLASLPIGFPVAIGSHGSTRGLSKNEMDLFRLKLGLTMPSEALVYGPVGFQSRGILENAGIPTRRFPDYRAICKSGMGKVA